MDLSYHTDDCITALATPWGESALAVIRTSGDGCIEKLSTIFSNKNKLLESKGHTLLLGNLFNKEMSEKIDQVVLGIYKGKESYTGQDSVEIFCHGSMPGIRLILKTLRDIGFRDAGPGEFTLRAFLNKKMDLTRAEAVNEIISSKSAHSHELALNRLSGGIIKIINNLKYDSLTG